ncbi:MAG: hypothetical protein GC157_09480 [Frankiales bacterium]|nr:hypothetical protein [Frankiales bacterium]
MTAPADRPQPSPGARTGREARVLAVAAPAALVLGWLSAHPLAGLGGWTVVVWAVAVVVLGNVPGTARGKALRLGLFGFVLGFSFLCFGYTGEAALVTRVLPFALLAVVSGLAAVALGALVHLVRSVL